jgi:hypothetical protein
LAHTWRGEGQTGRTFNTGAAGLTLITNWADAEKCMAMAINANTAIFLTYLLIIISFASIDVQADGWFNRPAIINSTVHKKSPPHVGRAYH